VIGTVRVTPHDTKSVVIRATAINFNAFIPLCVFCRAKVIFFSEKANENKKYRTNESLFVPLHRYHQNK
ncbi:MAG: hypothetical protein SOY53_09405, partial [Prevotella sp.]|uniref:hypothetical protein n=1 Tax=Leyella stercorea TaxID=363265 RepID=UPI0028020417|nr:hypothetical protein [Leyella stercorea]MDY4089617.1 hypothetical protein [Prevotella sp.]